MSNTLLQVFLLVFMELLMVGACGFLEHPAVTDLHELHQAPSIWFLDEVATIAQLAGASKAHCNQGRHGAASIKPTTFLLANAPDFQLHLEDNIDIVQRPVALQGSSNGVWNTAKGKEYPSPLCRAIASTVLAHANRVIYADIRTPDAPSNFELDTIESLVIPLDPYHQIDIGPDYACD